jgi:hypothetical protein
MSDNNKNKKEEVIPRKVTFRITIKSLKKHSTRKYQSKHKPPLAIKDNTIYFLQFRRMKLLKIDNVDSKSEDISLGDIKFMPNEINEEPNSNDSFEKDKKTSSNDDFEKDKEPISTDGFEKKIIISYDILPTGIYNIYILLYIIFNCLFHIFIKIVETVIKNLFGLDISLKRDLLESKALATQNINLIEHFRNAKYVHLFFWAGSSTIKVTVCY